MKKIFLIMLILFLTNISFSFSVSITNLDWPYFRPGGIGSSSTCWPLPLIYDNNSGNDLNVNFHISAGSNDSYNYKVDLIQFNNVTWNSDNYTDQGEKDETISIPYNNICTNNDAEVLVIVSYNNNYYTDKRYIRVYTELSTLGCPSNYGKQAMVTTNVQYNYSNIQNFVLYHINPCGLAYQDVAVQKCQITWTLYGNFSNTAFTVYPDLCYGFSAANPNDQYRWGGILYKDNNQVTFVTNVYQTTFNGGQTAWWPCQPGDAKIVYTSAYDPPCFQGPPQLICDEFYQSPSWIYANETGTFYSVWWKGNCDGPYCIWTPIGKPGYIIDNSYSNPVNLQLVNIGGCNLDPFSGVYQYTCLGCNQIYGCSLGTCDNNNGNGHLSPNVSCEPRPGGCPWVFVQDVDSNFYTDNNLLHRSEFPGNSGTKITDYYLINNTLAVFNNNINLKIIETNSDLDYLDKISLYAIDHPSNTKVGVTESNQIITYDPTQVNTCGQMYLNSTQDITNCINYYYTGDTVVTGFSSDIISAYNFSNSSSSIGDSLAILIGIGRNPDVVIAPVTKTPCGVINVYTNSQPNPISLNFARREDVSQVIIPYASANSFIDSAIINWNRDYELDWLGSAEISYSGFTMTEVTLINASHPLYDSALYYLQSNDGIYLVLDSLYQLNLTFNNSSSPQNGYIRDYVLETDGYYISNGAGFKPGLNHVTKHNNLVPLTNKLGINYPNPFNPSTKINYDISKDCNVKLIVYNLLGQRVITLVNEFKQAGSYSVNFDGSNLASGIYIYRIETPYFNDSKKMVLIK